MRRLVICLLLLAPFAAAQTGPGVTEQWLTFSLDRSGAPPVHYDVRVDQGTGQGFYHGAQGAASGTTMTAATPEIPISVDPITLKKLLAAVPFVEAHRCESHAKNLAQTGTKTLRYSGTKGVSECVYNYSDDDRVNTATTLFMAIGETMLYGDRLAAKLRFDRLGLDTEMDELQTALTDGRALGVGNIAPVLEAIQNDDRVMERVRRKAAHLLEHAGLPAAQPVAEAGPSPR